MGEPSVSVIVPVYNRAAMIGRCVRSVLSSSGEGVEVVVVDDASTDDPAGALAGIDGVRLIVREERGGPAAARNTGVEESRGEWIFFLDSDCWITFPGWISRHLEEHARRPGSVITGGVRGVHSTYGGAVDSYLNWFMFLGDPGEGIGTWHLPMTNVSMKRETFSRVGVFREEMQVLEDVDWSLRAREGGVSFHHLRDSAVLHQDQEGLQGAFEHQRKFGQWQRVLGEKNPGRRYAWLFPPSLAGSVAMALPLAVLMTVYIVGTVFPKDPKVLWYCPGILYGHCGHVLGIVESFLDRTEIPEKNEAGGSGGRRDTHP